MDHHRLREARTCIKEAQGWLRLAEELVDNQSILDKFSRDRFVLRLRRARAELAPVLEDSGPLWAVLNTKDKDHVRAIAGRAGELEELLPR